MGWDNMERAEPQQDTGHYYWFLMVPLVLVIALSYVFFIRTLKPQAAQKMKYKWTRPIF
uniref:Uncharacterized protein n=1 Tax=Anguilla anguilla TaxID=7936 RepID=A0A0E9QCB6_ANGAN